MIIDECKAVFFHIGKTGGVSVEKALIPKPRDYRVYDEKLIYGLRRGIMTQPATPKYVIRETRDRKPDISDYLWFTFVRNPWDRMVSAYCYLKPMHDRQFGDFDKWLEHKRNSVANGRWFEGSHYIPQTEYTHDSDGREIMDFIGKFESLEEDWSKVAEKLGRSELRLTHLNKSRLRKDGHYSLYYNDRTRVMVEDMYAGDIERFGYEF